MGFEVDRKELLEHPASDSLVRAGDKFLRAQSTTLGPLPDDRHFVIMAVGVPRKLTSVELDGLEASVNAIAGVQAAKVAITGKTPVGRVPATHVVHLRIDGQVQVSPKPPEG